MANKLIFVSCGQLTEAERTLGILVKAIIDGTPGFEAYFAETVHDLDALSHHVLDGIRRCAGAVVVLQDRGVVKHADGTEWGRRSSVWVNQEIAILAYRQFFETKQIPVLAFADPHVKLEGAMTSLIVNPHPLAATHDVAASVKTWLGETDFSDGSGDAFMAKWDQLGDSGRKVVAALLAEGGHTVKQTAIRHGVMKLFQIDSNAASKVVQESKLQFQNTDLVKLIQNAHSGDEMTVHPTWEFQLRKRSDQWLAEQGSNEVV